MSVSIHIDVDTSEVQRDLRRIADGPDRRHHLRFDAVLTRQFQDTQVRVHIDTGSLRASGRHHGQGQRNGGWRGNITYGPLPLVSTPIPGPARDPGEYARYEYTKPTDETYDHNFFRGILGGDEGYVDAILDFLRDDV